MNTELNVYEAADIKGRELFKEFCSTQSWCKMITESKPEDVWDVAYYSGSTKVIGEIKVRDKHSKQYLNWDYEHKKHHNLLDVYHKTKAKKRNQNKNIEIQYINFFNDDAVKIWTTTDLHLTQQPVLDTRNKSKVENKGDVKKLLYSCNLQYEAYRGLMYNIFNTSRADENEDDNLPF